MTHQPPEPDTTSTPVDGAPASSGNLFDDRSAPGVDGAATGARETTPVVPPEVDTSPADAAPPHPEDVGDQPGTDEPGAPEVPNWEQLAEEDPRTPGELLEELSTVAASRDEYLDSLQRKQAEFENFRRRMQQQAAQQRVAGHADVAGRVLEVLDDFDRTLASIAPTTDDGVLKGVTLVRDKLLGALREVGLERVDDRGAHFDPNRHEAVQQVSGEGLVGDDGEPVVAEVLRPGYVLGSKVLRAAMVAVAQ